jgi:predicted signal transduction protein with EAL and GGDEF domain
MEVPTDRLVLELTEGATQQFVKLMDTLDALPDQGHRPCHRRFRTGYSSLLQLRQLPFTELKIDRCFVVDLPTRARLRLIVKTIIELAHGLGLDATPRASRRSSSFASFANSAATSFRDS